MTSAQVPKQVGGVEKFTCKVIQGSNQSWQPINLCEGGVTFFGSYHKAHATYRLSPIDANVGEPVSLLPTIKVLGETIAKFDILTLTQSTYATRKLNNFNGWLTM